MKALLTDLIEHALQTLNIRAANQIHIDYPRERQHGDFACNIALVLAKSFKKNPRELATEIVSVLPSHDAILKIDIAGAGFINFFVAPHAWRPLLTSIIEQKKQFGRSTMGNGRKIHIEYVSSNPTGPLHVGHGRGAAYGATLADFLEAVGYTVHREYYVNDAGRQMDILAISIWLRYLSMVGENITFPANGYQGKYIQDIAQQLFHTHQKKYARSATLVFDAMQNPEINPEVYMDKLIARAKQLLGENIYHEILLHGEQTILTDIREDLAAFGVTYETWFSERSLWNTNAIAKAIALLRSKNHLYEQDGALWFRSTAFGDDKDRVVIRDNGQYTYFAADIAYHLQKFRSGFTDVIDILGADHHGYVPRLKAIIQALGYSVEQFHVSIIQFATLYRGKERVPMSTRSGEFVTLRELREEVGKDAARFFYITRKADQHMDFDLALATSQTNDNPVYYIQYAHARIASVFKQLAEKKLSFDIALGLSHMHLLTHDYEKILLMTLSRYPEIILQAAATYEPHQLAHYLRELADIFHRYYNACPFLVAEDNVRHTRLTLIAATRQVLANGLELLGVSAPETMVKG